MITDAHEGLKGAISQVFTATWQRCRVHFKRNLAVTVPKPQQAMVTTLVRQVFVQPDAESASKGWRRVADELRERFPKAIHLMDQAESDVWRTSISRHLTESSCTLPTRLRGSTKEAKRRTNVVGIFPNEASIRRLIAAVLMEQNEEWQLQHRYLPQHTMLETIGEGKEVMDLLPAA